MKGGINKRSVALINKAHYEAKSPILTPVDDVTTTPSFARESKLADKQGNNNGNRRGTAEQWIK